MSVPPFSLQSTSLCSTSEVNLNGIDNIYTPDNSYAIACLFTFLSARPLCQKVYRTGGGSRILFLFRKAYKAPLIVQVGQV